VINPGLPEERKLAGRRCLVVKAVMKETRGIVKLYRDNGKIDPSYVWIVKGLYQFAFIAVTFRVGNP